MMREKLLLLAALLSLLLSATSFTSCSDNEGITDNPGSHTLADYTIIFWGMNGSQDENVFADLGDMLNKRKSGEIGQNVNFVGLLKSASEGLSLKNLQQALATDGLDGTQYIELPAHPTADLPVMTYEPDPYDKLNVSPVQDVEMIKKIYRGFNAQHYGDTDYPLNNIDSLAAFISNVAQTHPAKHYVLMLLGHGAGFQPDLDTPDPEAYTRYCVTDSYSQQFITADGLVAAVRKSGVHLQTIFFQCCLMATVENLAAYQHCTDYAILSCEVTTSRYLQNYLAYLSQAGDDLEKMKQASRRLVDFYASINPTTVYCTSQGFYDLSQTGTLLNAVRDASTWYADAVAKDPDLIYSAVMASCICDDMQSYASDFPEQNLLALRDNLHALFLKPTLTNEDMDYLSYGLQTLSFVLVRTGTVFANLMHATLSIKKKSTVLDFAPLQAAYDSYMTTLRSMAYIKGNQDASDVAPDYFYLTASPSINLFSMNEQGFKAAGMWEYQKDTALLNRKLEEFCQAKLSGNTQRVNQLGYELFDGTIYALGNPLAYISANYQASQFDQFTHWSDFLQKLQVSPTFITNQTRADYYRALK